MKKCLLSAALVGLSALAPSTVAVTTGCGACNYTINFDLHATVVDAATGQPIAAPTFTSATSGKPLNYARCETPVDAGPCTVWGASTVEGTSPSTILVGAPGYAPQSQAVPAGVTGRCGNDDELTKTFQLAKMP